MRRRSTVLVLIIGLLAAGCVGAIQYNDAVKPVDLQTVEGEAVTRVAANADEWRNSGVIVKRGVTYRITATGRWTAGPVGAMGGLLGLCGWTGPDAVGIAGFCHGARGHIIGGGGASLLVARIGDGPPFAVGAQLDLVADADGILYFRINDGPIATGDNEGSVVVKIAAARPSAPARAAAAPRPQPPAAEPRGMEVSSGSGFLLRDTNLILTNNHVVRDRAQITIAFPSGEEYPGRVVSRDRGNDLALVEARGLTAGSRGLVVASGVEIRVGETVHALGYPLGVGLSRRPSMVSGTISSAVGLDDDIARFRTTAPINPGNSGGPIVNDRGEVLGVAVAGVVREGVEAIRFGIKASSAIPLLQQARLTTSFDITVKPAYTAPRQAAQIFSDVSPSVVLIEVR